MACLYTAIITLAPTSYWIFGEPSGTSVNDEIGSNDLTLVNTPTLGVTGLATGDSRTACQFAEASSEHATVADHADLDLGDVFSILVMVKRDTTGIMHILNKNSGADGYALWFDGTDNLRLSNSNFGTTWLFSLSTYADTSTHMILATKNGATRAMYVDGADDTDLGTNATATDNAGTLYVGAPSSGLSNPFDGTMQHLAFWKGTALTSGDAATLWASRTDSCWSRAQAGVDAGVTVIHKHGGL